MIPFGRVSLRIVRAGRRGSSDGSIPTREAGTTGAAEPESRSRRRLKPALRLGTRLARGVPAGSRRPAAAALLLVRSKTENTHSLILASSLGRLAERPCRCSFVFTPAIGSPVGSPASACLRVAYTTGADRREPAAVLHGSRKGWCPGSVPAGRPHSPQVLLNARIEESPPPGGRVDELPLAALDERVSSRAAACRYCPFCPGSISSLSSVGSGLVLSGSA